MRLTVILLFVILSGCVQAVSQKPNKELKNDTEFYELLKKARETKEKTRARIQAADEYNKQVVSKTVTSITTLKTEVKELKTDLNEANKKLDSVVDANTGNSYKLLPIIKVSYN